MEIEKDEPVCQECAYQGLQEDKSYIIERLDNDTQVECAECGDTVEPGCDAFYGV